MGVILALIPKYDVSTLEPIDTIETCTISENYKIRILALLPELIRDASLILSVGPYITPITVGFGEYGYGDTPFGQLVYPTPALEATKRPVTFTIGA